METWRLLVMGALFLAAGGMGFASAAGGGESAELAAKRREMQRRERRIIYNDDGNELFITKLSSPEGFLAQRIVPALGTQVDSIFFCTLVTTLYKHDTEVAERWDDLVDAIGSKEAHALNGRDNMRMLRAGGKDCLTLVVEKCHEAGLEVVWSHRINDVHDSVLAWDYLLSQWKRKHPECVMGKPEDTRKYPMKDPRFWWSALDFEKEEVRDYLSRINEEVCQRYDVDGIEIDYFRSPMFFRPNLEFQPATEAQVAMMTGFQRRAREMVYGEGNRRGRPILLAARVPMTVRTCRHVGIDIEVWLAEGLVDVLTTGGGYMPFTMPTGELVEMGHAHGIPVYPTISASGLISWGNSVEAWRGAASTAWLAGADGMYTFNWFPGAAKDPVFMTIGDPEGLSKLDKLFAVEKEAVTEGMLAQGIEQSQILPVELDGSGKERAVNLPVGDDVAGAAGMTLRVQYEGKGEGDEVELRVNGTAVRAKEEGGDGWVRYDAAPAVFRRGGNAASFRVLGRAGGEGIVVKGAELDVRYR